MNEPELLRLLRNIARVVGATALLSLPFVAWAAVRHRRARWAVPGAPLDVPGGSYRGATVSTTTAGTLPWIVYVALLASLMGAAFVLVAVGYVFVTTHALTPFAPSLDLGWTSGVAASLARFVLLFASVAVLRQRRWASRATAWAVGYTLASVALFAASVHEDSLHPHCSDAYLIDASFYAGGLLITALLVACADRAVARRALA